MAYKAIDIAKKIVCRTDVEHGDTISNLKLQKLLYYMQGFHLAFFNAPFFNESIEAWTYGPVVPVVFQEFKRYKQRAINPENYHDELVLTNEEQQMFDIVYGEYNRFSAVTLMNMTHTEGPWKNHGIGDEITNDELRTFFLTQIDRSEPTHEREESEACFDFPEREGGRRSQPFQTDEYGRIVLTENMREAVRKAEKSLSDGSCLTEEMFQTRFAKWM